MIFFIYAMNHSIRPMKNFTYDPAPKPSRITYDVQFSTRYDRKLFKQYANQMILVDAVHSFADANDINVLSIAATESTARIHFSMPITMPLSKLTNRLKIAVARALKANNPGLEAGVFRREVRLYPIAPHDAVPHPARPLGTDVEESVGALHEEIERSPNSTVLAFSEGSRTHA